MILALILLNNIFQIHLSKPIELLRGGQVGEKEPKVKWPLVLIGGAALGVGYYIAITTESPLDALLLFFVAVILVIIGTYCLFTAGSIAILKLLRKNKGYYYKTKHFTTVSGMMYRMKQNAVGLANICILSTMVLVMVSSTLSLFIGMEDSIKMRYPHSITVESRHVTDQEAEQIGNIIASVCEKHGADRQGFFAYRSLTLLLSQQGDAFSADQNINMTSSNYSAVILMPLSEYNKIVQTPKTLSEGECLLHVGRGTINGESVQLGEKTYTVRERLESFEKQGIYDAMLVNNFYIVVPDDEDIA